MDIEREEKQLLKRHEVIQERIKQLESDVDAWNKQAEQQQMSFREREHGLAAESLRIEGGLQALAQLKAQGRVEEAQKWAMEKECEPAEGND